MTIIRIILFWLLLLASGSSCIVNKNPSRISYKNEQLDFSNCSVASEAYRFIRVEMPKGYSKEFIENESICEYRFSFKDGSIAYISNDVWFGSRLNFGNRHLIGHESYNKNNLLDTILLNGLQPNNLNWSEQIIGDLMIGYVNASDSKRALFEKSFSTITKIR